MRNLIGTASAFAMIVATSTPAFALDDPTPPPAPDATRLAAMAQQCATVAETFGQTTPGNNTYYSVAVEVDPGEDSDPIFAGNRVNDASSWTPDLSSIHTLNGPDASASTQLRRNGKSPNIFATDVRASSETWSNNSVDFTADYLITTTFNYTCDVTEQVWTPPTPTTYTYKVKPGNPGADDCSRWDDEYDHVGYGGPLGNCVVDTTTPGAAGYHTPNPLGSQGDFIITQDRTENLGDTDSNAGPHTYYDTNALGHAVVCISPGSKGGEWRAQNLYGGLGGTCSTSLFNSLPPGTSIPSNSLPVS